MELDLTLLEWINNKNNNIAVFLDVRRMSGISVNAKNTVEYIKQRDAKNM